MFLFVLCHTQKSKKKMETIMIQDAREFIKDIVYECDASVRLIFNNILLPEHRKIIFNFIFWSLFVLCFAFFGNRILINHQFQFGILFVIIPICVVRYSYIKHIFNDAFSLSLISTFVMFINLKMFIGCIVGLCIQAIINSVILIITSQRELYKTVEYAINIPDNFMCVICFDNSKDFPIIKIKSCGHLFHSDCFRIWSRDKKRMRDHEAFVLGRDPVLSQHQCVIPYCVVSAGSQRLNHVPDNIKRRITEICFEIKLNAFIINNNFPFVVNKRQVWKDIHGLTEWQLDYQMLLRSIVLHSSRVLKLPRPLGYHDQTTLSIYEATVSVFPDVRHWCETVYVTHEYNATVSEENRIRIIIF